MKTIFAKKTDVTKKWHIVDADGMVVGRLASQVAKILRGKNKAIFTPNIDTGDFVIVVNAKKARFTGNKLSDKLYYRHSGYPGGIRKENARDIMETRPERIIEAAVRGMLPKNRLGRRQFSKLKVYSGPDHPHTSQSPEPLNITTL
ncbi:MAG: 50S ribosomal protein L13 [Nitrospiraceae bacterium]|nr:MAG: 50S ribosomal protein L13 [Nitrospiraceae bacterium]